MASPIGKLRGTAGFRQINFSIGSFLLGRTHAPTNSASLSPDYCNRRTPCFAREFACWPASWACRGAKGSGLSRALARSTSKMELRLGECPRALSIIPLSTHQAVLIPEWGQPPSSSMAVRCRARRPAPDLPHAVSRSKLLRSSAWQAKRRGRAKTRIGENVNLRDSCEDDPAAIALMIKNTKSPHFRDALPVLISRLLLNFVSAVYDLGVPQCLISSSAEISCWRMIPRPCKKRSSCC